MPASPPDRPFVPEISGLSIIEHAVALTTAGLQLVLLHAPRFGKSSEPSEEYPVATGCTCGAAYCGRGKHPIAKSWQKKPIVDPIAAREAISSNAFPPNLGLVLGLQPSGRYVIAVDVDDADRYAALQVEYGELPETARCDSGRGTRLFFTIPDQAPRDRLKNITGLGGESGIDVKVAGGQVVIAPSWHLSGVRYTWSRFGEIVELPPNWVLAILSKPEVPDWTYTYTPSSMKGDARAQRRAERYLQGAVMSEATLVARTGKGLRNTTLYNALCRLLSLAHGVFLPSGHSYVVREISNAARAAGLSLREIQTTVASAERWIQESGAQRVPFVATPPPDAETPVEEESSAPPPEPAPVEPIELIMDNQAPAKIASNVARLLTEHELWLGGPKRDLFCDRVFWPEPLPLPLQRIKRRGPELCDEDEIALQGWLMTLRFSIRVKAGIEVVHAGVLQAARWNAIDSLVDRVTNLPEWDRIERLSTWLTIYAGVINTPVSQIFGRRWLISTIARALVPGCVADSVLVLEGATGIGKNRLITSIFGDAPFVQSIGAYKVGHDIEADWIADTSWIIHDDEMRARGSDLDALKSWISRREDTYRKKFERNKQTHPRRAVMIGSTERDHYFHDETNRRFLPVRCGVIDFDKAARDAPQLLSEAREAYRTGERWTIGRSDPLWLDFVEAQDARRVVDPFGDDVRRKLIELGMPERVTVSMIADRLDIPPERRDRALATRIGCALRDSDYERRRELRDGMREYVYVRCPT